MGFSLVNNSKEMSRQESKYDVAIAGGGLAGLSLAIQLRKQGHAVILFEKEKYPFHRVCGEYISKEALPFMESLGLNLDTLGAVSINKLIVSSPDGNLLREELVPGGIGISRYTLDLALSKIAADLGAVLMEQDKIQDIIFNKNQFAIRAASGNFASTAVAGSFGKRSNLDLKWKRAFTNKKPSKLNNYIGVKYHVRTDFPRDTIALHNFPDGYCGISAIEDGKFCLCYLTTAANLEAHGNSIRQMEQEVLSTNPHLQKIFSNAVFEFPQPVTISQISFDSKTRIEDHVLMLGDAAGMITPLCGNGMSMAMQGSKLAAFVMHQFLEHRISRHEMERRYMEAWDHEFSGRLKTGRMIQSLFGKPTATNLFIRAMKPFPFLVKQLIRKTHGEPF
jgi:flavin-dependent dehydrogenase